MANRHTGCRPDTYIDRVSTSQIFEITSRRAFSRVVPRMRNTFSCIAAICAASCEIWIKRPVSCMKNAALLRTEKFVRISETQLSSSKNPI